MYNQALKINNLGLKIILSAVEKTFIHGTKMFCIGYQTKKLPRHRDAGAGWYL